MALSVLQQLEARDPAFIQTIVTSQLDPTHGHDYLAEPTLADAICDRLSNNAHRLALKGPSRRKEDPNTKKDKT